MFCVYSKHCKINIERKDGPVWVMNHFFVNPDFDLEQELDQEMPTALLI